MGKIERVRLLNRIVFAVLCCIISSSVYVVVNITTKIIVKHSLNHTNYTQDVDSSYEDHIGISENNNEMSQALFEELISVSQSVKELKNALVVDQSEMTIHLLSNDVLRIHTLLKDVNLVIEEPNMYRNEAIATNINNGELLFSQDIVGKNVVVPYEEDGFQIIFCGKYNEQYHWDGECVVNAYKNGILVSITEANYDDGSIINYKQAFVDSGFWYTSKRTIVGEKDGMPITSGETWKYKYKNDIKLDFDFYSSTSENMITVDKLRLKEKQKLFEYYYGNTWHGSYWDNTGKALLIKYNDDLTVRTLYVGSFSDGQFDDTDAWEIAQQNETKKYYYYEGSFVMGQRPKHRIDQKPLSIAEIEEVLYSNDLNLNIDWYNE